MTDSVFPILVLRKSTVLEVSLIEEWEMPKAEAFFVLACNATDRDLSIAKVTTNIVKTILLEKK